MNHGHQEERDPLAEAVGDLERSIPPSDDLWPAIRVRIGDRQARRDPLWRRALVPAAAAAVLLVMFGSGIMGPADQRGDALQAPLLAAWEEEYARIVSQLWERFRSQPDGLPPETLEVIERNLQVIDTAIADSRIAVAENPSDVGLQQTLADAWRQKVELLGRAEKVAARYQGG